jgi:uncharacterized protein (DUF2267 family)
MEKQILQQIQERAGISEQQAKAALDTVVGFLKERLPEPIAGQVDMALKGDMGDLGGMAAGLGGLFGKKE